MKYPKIAAALGWTETPDLQEGLHLQPEETATIENKFTEHETSLSQAIETGNQQLANSNQALSTASGRVTELEGELSTANTNLSTINDQLSTVNSQLSTATTDLATANAEITRLKELSGSASGTTTEKDKFENGKVAAMDLPFQKELLSQV